MLQRKLPLPVGSLLVYHRQASLKFGNVVLRPLYVITKSFYVLLDAAILLLVLHPLDVIQRLFKLNNKFPVVGIREFLPPVIHRHYVVCGGIYMILIRTSTHHRLGYPTVN